MKLVQISDLHLLAPGRRLPPLGIDPLERLQAALALVRAEHADAAALLLTGDLADAGEPAAYGALAAALAGLPMPTLLLPGNHDDRRALRAAFPALPVDGAGFVQQALDLGGHRLLLLDTLAEGQPHGVFDAPRARFLAQALAEGDGPVLLALHHPPFDCGIAAMDADRLRDTGPLWQALAPHRARIRHLFCGHLHRGLAGSWRGIPVSCTRAPVHQLALRLGAGAVLAASDATAQLAVVLVDEERVVVHQQDVPGEGRTVDF